jgi:hypothetical protein
LRFRSLEDTEFEKSTDIREIKQLSLSIKLRISKVSNEVEIAIIYNYSLLLRSIHGLTDIKRL